MNKLKRTRPFGRSRGGNGYVFMLEGFYISLFSGINTVYCFSPDKRKSGDITRGEFEIGTCYKSLLFDSKCQIPSYSYGYGFEEDDRDGVLKVTLVDSFSKAPPTIMGELIYYKGFLVEKSIADQYKNSPEDEYIPMGAERFNVALCDRFGGLEFRTDGTYLWADMDGVEEGTYTRDEDQLIVLRAGEIVHPLLIYNRIIIDQGVFCTPDVYAKIYQ